MELKFFVSLTNPEFIGLFQNRSAAAADHRAAVSANEWIVHFAVARGAIQRFTLRLFGLAHANSLRANLHPFSSATKSHSLQPAEATILLRNA